MLFTIPCLGQHSLRGKVSISEDSRGLKIYDKTRGEDSYKVYTSRSRKRKLKTDTIYAVFQVLEKGEVVASGITDSDGSFKVQLVDTGRYKIEVDVNRFIHKDTVVNITKKKNKVNIILSDHKMWNYYDSIQIAKYPYNSEVARRDIENEYVQVLAAGLLIFSGEESDQITCRYGFKYLPVAGCVMEPYLKKAMEAYNDVVFKHLDSINEEGWQIRMKAEFVELLRARYRE
ncbi:hypothetical protein GCM10009122_38980 [Fulvivirga kasyanovii]